MLKCVACGRRYRAPSYDPERAYACRRCGGALIPASSAGEPAQTAEEGAAALGDHEDPLLGKQIGHYRILEKLGEGGMGAVYKAEHVGLRRVSALKLLPQQKGESSQRPIRRFLREALSVAALSHPNIVALFNVGEADGWHFIDMEFVDGESVRRLLLRKKRLSVTRATAVLLGTARALSAAHAQGIVHRDIKPANILLDRNGTVRVVDFGLAKDIAGDDSAATADGKGGLGTPAFMSPEQCEGFELDGRSDIYSLGATYFYLLTGELPFGGDSGLAMMRQHRTEPVPDPKSVVPSLPETVCDIIRRAMAKKPEERYQSCEELVFALSGALRPSEKALPSPVRAASSQLAGIWRELKRHRMTALVSLTTMLLLVCAVGSILTETPGDRVKLINADLTGGNANRELSTSPLGKEDDEPAHVGPQLMDTEPREPEMEDWGMRLLAEAMRGGDLNAVMWPERTARPRNCLGTPESDRRQTNKARESPANWQSCRGATAAPSMCKDRVAQGRAYADRLSKMGWLDLAANVYDDILSHAPNHPDIADVRHKAARAYFQAGDYGESAKHFQSLLTTGAAPEQRVTGLYWTAESYYATGQYQRALDFFKKCMKECIDQRDERCLHSKYGAGWCHYKLEEYERAVEHLAAFADMYFYSELVPDAQLTMGKAYTKMGKCDDACRAFQLVSESNSSPELQAQALLGSGRARFDDKRLLEAMASFGIILAEHSASAAAPEAMWLQGRVFEEWRERERSHQIWAQLAKLYPRSAYGRKAVIKLDEGLGILATGETDQQGLSEEHLYGLAEAAYREGHFDRAEKLYQKVLSLYPKGSRVAGAHYRIAICSVRNGDYRKARTHFLRIRSDLPRGGLAPEVAYLAAYCACEDGDYSKSRKLVEQLLTTKPQRDLRSKARFLLGECLRETGAYPNAIEQYERAAAFAVDDCLSEVVAFRLGSTWYLSKEFARAAQTLRGFRHKYPGSVHCEQALYLEAESRSLIKEYGGAERLFATYVARYPKGESVSHSLCKLGHLAERAGRHEDALAHYRKARDIADGLKDSAVVGQAEERIAWALHQQGNRGEALEAYGGILRNWPDRKLAAETHNWVGLALLRAHRHEDAKHAFEMLLAHYSEDKAYSLFVQHAYYRLACCHQTSDEEESQLKMLRVLVTSFPNSQFTLAAKVVVADGFLRRGLKDRAESLYREAAESLEGPPQAEALYKLGELLLGKDDKDDYVEALKLFDRVTRSFDAPNTRIWQIKAEIGAGRFYEALSQLGPAEHHYHRAADLAQGDSEQVRELKRDATERLMRLSMQVQNTGEEEDRR